MNKTRMNPWARRRRRDSTTIALIGCALAVWLVAGYFALAGRRGLFGGDDLAASAEPSESPPPPAASSAADPPAEPSAHAPVEDVGKCVAAFFPEKSFRQPPDFEFVCTQPDPVKGALEVKKQVVKGAGGSTSMAMREWVQLGWYEMLAYALLRARCCAKPPPLAWSFELACPVDEPLRAFEKAVSKPEPDAQAIEKALFDYGGEIRCLSRFGQAPNFNQGAPPGSGVESLYQLMARAGLPTPEG